MLATTRLNLIRFIFESFKCFLLQLFLEIFSSLKICPLFLFYSFMLLTIQLFLLFVHPEVFIIKLIRVDIKVRIMLLGVIIIIVLIILLVCRVDSPLQRVVRFLVTISIFGISEDLGSLGVRRKFFKFVGLLFGLRFRWGLCGRFGGLFFFEFFSFFACFILEIFHLFFKLLNTGLDRSIPNVRKHWFRESLELTPYFLDHSISS